MGAFLLWVAASIEQPELIRFRRTGRGRIPQDSVADLYFPRSLASGQARREYARNTDLILKPPFALISLL